MELVAGCILIVGSLNVLCLLLAVHVLGCIVDFLKRGN